MYSKKHKRKQPGFSLKRSFVYLPLVALCGSASANPGEPSLEIQVLERQSGTVIPEVSVCVGTAADPKQFGARRTGADGAARFENLPINPLVITVSGQGLQGVRQSLQPVAQNRTLVMKVASGGGGPRCNAPRTQGADSGLEIQRVELKNLGQSDARTQKLSLRINTLGKANQVRVSDRSDFAGAEWRALRNPVLYNARRGSGSDRLYVQVRNWVNMEGASLEVLSPVEEVYYTP